MLLGGASLGKHQHLVRADARVTEVLLAMQTDTE